MSTRGTTRRRAAVATLATAALLGAGMAPALAADLDDWTITGVQFVNGDCSRNEYTIDATITGTTDDVNGFDRVMFRVWDDGVAKDSRIVEVPVGTTEDVHAFLSFVGLYLTGAPGVGMEVMDVDADGNDVSQLDYIDPYYPEDREGPCTFDVERIGGADRIETAAMLSEQKFMSADTVMLATSATYPDALTAAPWAAEEGAPLLLTRKGSLSGPAQAELERLSPEHVVVIGGAASISDAVIDDIQDALPGADVDRVAGADRYDTAGLIAREVGQDSSPEMYLASGEQFPDALVLSALASRHSAPLLLVKQGSIPAATQSALDDIYFENVYAAGGTSVIADSVLSDAADGMPTTRFAGSDRYETAADVLAEFPAEGKVLVATGESFPDSLTSVPVAARTGAGIALTRPDTVPASVMSEIERLVDGFSYPLITIVGGTASVHPSVETDLQGLFETALPPTQRPAGTQTDRNIGRD